MLLPPHYYIDIDITAIVKKHREEDDTVPSNDESSVEETRKAVATALELLKAVSASSMIEHDDIVLQPSQGRPLSFLM